MARQVVPAVWVERGRRSTGTGPRPSTKHKRRRSPDLELQELESRTLLSVTAFFNPAGSTDLDVDLSAGGDQATITPSGSTIQVGGTGYSGGSFSGVTKLVVQGSGASNQGVTFGGSGGTITLDTAPGTTALTASGISSLTFTDVTIDASSINLAASGTIDIAAGATLSSRQIASGGNPLTAPSIGNSGAQVLAAPNIEVADGARILANANSGYASADVTLKPRTRPA